MPFFLRNRKISDDWYEVTENFFRKAERANGFLPTAVFNRGPWEGRTFKPHKYHPIPKVPHNAMTGCFLLGERGMCHC